MPRFDRIPRLSASKMQSESARLLSFSKGWPRSSPVRPADLARAGLYHMGFSDLVACFRCGGTMHRWEEGDDPAREHARHFPACARAVGDASDGAGRGQFDELTASPSSPSTLPSQSSSSSPLSSLRLSLGGAFSPQAPLPPATQDGADSGLSPEMRSFGARLRSFASWPYTANVSPPELAYAGFYYSAVPSTEELLDKLEERLSCKVCMEREVSTMFVPCGHVATCGHCALSLIQCPVCRVAVKTSLRAFVV
uniref:Baculoviral IAP repeat-containing protein 2-like n=1 Tax=Petromyzon marinus TaxID=7757 RepID=A0AAJ7SJZ0_PETMA|nr:baculoviral IAP repeat-containing protein 2-like [Petromyzon marinus]